MKHLIIILLALLASGCAVEDQTTPLAAAEAIHEPQIASTPSDIHGFRQFCKNWLKEKTLARSGQAGQVVNESNFTLLKVESTCDPNGLTWEVWNLNRHDANRDGIVNYKDLGE